MKWINRESWMVIWLPVGLPLAIISVLALKTHIEKRQNVSTVRFSWEAKNTQVGIERVGDGSDAFIDSAIDAYRYLVDKIPPTAGR